MVIIKVLTKSSNYKIRLYKKLADLIIITLYLSFILDISSVKRIIIDVAIYSLIKNLLT